MKSMPWQDIIPLPKWNTLLDNYKRGQMQSKAKTLGHKVSYFFTRQVPLPKEILTLTQKIGHYHNIPKRSVGDLETRAGELRAIAAIGRQFLTAHKVQPKHELKSTLGGDQYKAYKKAYLDYHVSKVVRRAERKADYIDQLKKHLDNADRGFTGREEVLEYIKSKAQRLFDDDLVGLRAHQIMERIDPWHRSIGLKISNKTNLPTGHGGTIYGHAFIEWMRDLSRDLPFFVWLEGHYICTDKDAGTDWLGPDYPDGHVSYDRNDEELAGYVHLISVANGALWAYRMKEGGEVDVDLFDTKDAQAEQTKGKLHATYAYVWSRDGFIFAALHKIAEIHHSSFVSGQKVRCAGMIGVDGGKVRWVDNASGHYHPDTRHLYNFVGFLHRHNVFAPDAQVEDHSTSPETRTSLNEFLAGRTLQIRQDWERLKSKRTTLHDLVEARFRAMRAEIGPAPEHLLWTRAYKAVCLDFATIDQSWERKANAPPIPRAKAPRRS